jgi:peptidoglycan/LPS O-acetylase OafA/YrhL
LRRKAYQTGVSQAARPSLTAARKPRQDNIDLLRAIAILAVVVYHYTTRYPRAYHLSDTMPFSFGMGRHGVDLFFIVSGFCIFMTMDSSHSLANFWARRFARIQPAYVVGIMITFAIVTIGGLPDREVSPAIAVSNMAWLNVLPNWPHVDHAYWTLVVELKFYVLFGLIHFCVKGRHVSLAWLGLCVVGLALELVDGIPRQVASQLLIAPSAPFFLIGLLAWEWRRLTRPEAAAIGMAALPLATMSPRFVDYPLAAMAIAVAAFLVLQLKQLRVAKPITLVGLVSYSFYLLHQNIGYVLIRNLDGPIEFRVLAAVAIVFAMAVAMYLLVERRWERAVRQHAEHLLTSGAKVLVPAKT